MLYDAHNHKLRKDVIMFLFSMQKFHNLNYYNKYNKSFSCEYCLFYFSFQILLTILNMNENFRERTTFKNLIKNTKKLYCITCYCVKIYKTTCLNYNW